MRKNSDLAVGMIGALTCRAIWPANCGSQATGKRLSFHIRHGVRMHAIVDNIASGKIAVIDAIGIGAWIIAGQIELYKRSLAQRRFFPRHRKFWVILASTLRML